MAKTINVRALRKRLKLSQEAFWTPLGVTQSGGSRYESGRRLTKPLQKLLTVRYGTATQVRAELARLRPDAVVHIASKHGD